MPCYTVKKTTVNVSNMDLDVLAAGLKAAGFDVKQEGASFIFSRKGSYLYHSFKAGALELSGNDVEALTAEVKRAYSAQVVRQTAERFGWKTSTKDNQQFMVQKRR